MPSVDEVIWQLPGPEAFLEGVISDLRQGCSVIMCLPEHAAPGLLNAVDRRVREMDLCHIVEVALSDSTPAETPLSAIRRALDGPSRASTGDEARELAGDPACRGKLFWVDGLTEASWQCWLPFLEQYALVARAAWEVRLPRVVAVLRGRLAIKPPRGDVGLAVRTWRGIVGALDVLVLVTRLMPDDGAPSLDRRLRIWIAAELASADPVLAAHLCRCELRELLNPLKTLTGFAEERRWTRLPESSDERWAAGMADRIDGIHVIHSAALVLNGRRDELERRIWRAQVAILFPLIEEQRARLLRSLDRHLQVPFHTPYGRIDSKHDLEITHIRAQLMRSDAPIDEKRLADNLVRIRNALAHLKIVDESLLSELASLSEVRTGSR